MGTLGGTVISVGCQIQVICGRKTLEVSVLTASSSIIAAESKKSGLNSARSRLFLDGGWSKKKKKKKK